MATLTQSRARTAARMGMSGLEEALAPKRFNMAAMDEPLARFPQPSAPSPRPRPRPRSAGPLIIQRMRWRRVPAWRRSGRLRLDRCPAAPEPVPGIGHDASQAGWSARCGCVHMRGDTASAYHEQGGCMRLGGRGAVHPAVQDGQLPHGHAAHVRHRVMQLARPDRHHRVQHSGVVEHRRDGLPRGSQQADARATAGGRAGHSRRTDPVKRMMRRTGFIARASGRTARAPMTA